MGGRRVRYRRNLGPRLTCAYADIRKGHADCAAREHRVASQQGGGPRRVAWMVLGSLLLVGLLCCMAGCDPRAHAGVHYAKPGPAGSALSTFTKNVFMMISHSRFTGKGSWLVCVERIANCICFILFDVLENAILITTMLSKETANIKFESNNIGPCQADVLLQFIGTNCLLTTS